MFFPNWDAPANGALLCGGKYYWLYQNNLTTTQWTTLNCNAPFYLFVPQDIDLRGEYELGCKITEIFPLNSTGIVTARDHFAIQWTSRDVFNIVQDFVNLPVEDARNKYNLGEDKRDWKVHFAQSDIRSTGIDKNKVVPILYRPFDVRYTYYTVKSRGFHCTPRGDVMRHMLVDNIALLTSRMTKGEQFAHIQVTNLISEKILMSPKTSNNSFHFPLYLHPNPNNPKELEEPTRPNFSPEFLNAITSKLGYTPTPEAIFYYIYAIFHSPTYRIRYAEFLKIDFPRVPLTSDDKLFRQLATYGEELVALHLMKSPKLNNLITQFVDTGGNCLVDAGHPKFINENEVVINKKGDKFTGIPENIWNFYVGGYQVCQKWLKDRKGRQLSDEDIQHYQRIVVALKETIELMAQIDEAIPGFPIE
ncbi:MAG: type ISP restriction/modification enzyme [Nostochopsis sp.]